MSALILVHRGDDGRASVVPFACHDGQMLMAVESIADYLAGAGLFDSFWESVAVDRLRVILEQRAEIAMLREGARELRAMLGQTPVRELIGGAA